MPFVYCATNSITGKKYIGICNSKVRRRWRRHCTSAWANKPRNRNCPAFHAAIRKYGEAAFVIETLCEVADWPEACAVERRLIAEHGTMVPNGYNLTGGGEGRLGCKFSPEEHRRRSEWAKAHPPSPEQRAKMKAHMKGRKLSPEHVEQIRQRVKRHMADPAVRAALSEARRGRSPTPEAKEKNRLSQIGRKHSAETKAKMSAWQIGRQFTPEHIANIKAGLARSRERKLAASAASG